MTNKTKTNPFSKLTNAEKRVTIARDVLKQLKSKRLIAKTGDYFYSAAANKALGDFYTNSDETTIAELSDVIKYFSR